TQGLQCRVQRFRSGGTGVEPRHEGLDAGVDGAVLPGQQGGQRLGHDDSFFTSRDCEKYKAPAPGPPVPGTKPGNLPAMTDTPLTAIPLTTLDGQATTLADLAEGAALIVNVASKCGLTPQYRALEELAQRYGPRGLTVVGVPCNQFMNQEPGTPEEIRTFCSTTYGVTFPLLAKTDV